MSWVEGSILPMPTGLTPHEYIYTWCSGNTENSQSFGAQQITSDNSERTAYRSLQTMTS